MSKYLSRTVIACWIAEIFRRPLFYGIITCTCIHYFYSPRHCKRRSGSILNLLMFYNLIKSAVLPKSICDMSFYYEQVWRVRNWGFDIDFKVTSFRLNSDIFKSQGLGCRILKFFVICPQGPKWLKWVVLSVLVYCIKNTHWKSC